MPPKRVVLSAEEIAAAVRTSARRVVEERHPTVAGLHEELFLNASPVSTPPAPSPSASPNVECPVTP
jgi:hypothetical protein